MVSKLGKIFAVGSLAALFGLAALLAVQPVSAGNHMRLPADDISINGCPSPPTISFTPTNPNPGQEVTFTGGITSTGGGGIITFTWSFGDGSSLADGTYSIKHTYTANGVFTVMMTATGQDCAAPPQASAVITVGFGTPAAILYFPIIFTPGLLPTAQNDDVITASQQIN